MGRKAEVQRMQLEKLMGPEAMGISTEKLDFSDTRVCRNFLCGTCPHDLFSNTKVDLGPCPKSHTPRLKIEFEAARAAGTSTHRPFFEEHEHNIRSFIADVDRKIGSNKRRLDQTPEESAKFSNLMREIAEVEAALQAAMAEVERLGEAEQVEESLAELQKAEALKSEKAGKDRELQALNESAGASGHQKLRVCDVCGAYLSILDSDRRLADHFGGRMHLGYLRLREMISEFDDRRRQGIPPGGHPKEGAPNGAGDVNGHATNGGGGTTDYRPRDRREADRERDCDRDRDRDRDRGDGRRRDDRDDGYSSRRDDRDRDRERRRSRSPSGRSGSGSVRR